MTLILLVLLAQAPVTITNKTATGHIEVVKPVKAVIRPVPDTELSWLRANQYFSMPPEWLNGPTESIYNPGPNWPLPPAWTLRRLDHLYPSHGGIPLYPTYGRPYYPSPIRIVPPVSRGIGSRRR